MEEARNCCDLTRIDVVVKMRHAVYTSQCQGIAYISEHNPNDLRAPRGTIDMSVAWMPMAFVWIHSERVKRSEVQKDQHG